MNAPTVDKNVSPYALAKVAEVKPQMIYNYINKGYIVAEQNELGKKFITPEVANAWLTKYFEKNRKSEAELEVSE